MHLLRAKQRQTGSPRRDCSPPSQACRSSTTLVADLIASSGGSCNSFQAFGHRRLPSPAPSVALFEREVKYAPTNGLPDQSAIEVTVQIGQRILYRLHRMQRGLRERLTITCQAAVSRRPL